MYAVNVYSIKNVINESKPKSILFSSTYIHNHIIHQI